MRPIADSLVAIGHRIIMRINVKVKANSKEEKIEPLGNNQFAVKVKAPAHEGKANNAVIKLLSKYFDIPKSMIIISKGQQNNNKIIDIEN